MSQEKADVLYAKANALERSAQRARAAALALAPERLSEPLPEVPVPEETVTLEGPFAFGVESGGGALEVFLSPDEVLLD